MRRMARIIITFMVGIYFLQYLPSLMSYISKKASDGISSVTQMAQDTISEKINDVKNWDVGESIQQLISGGEQQTVKQETTTDVVRITDSSRIKDAQEKLNELGYDAGGVDGIWGPRTRSAMNSYQTTNGMRQTEYLNEETYQSIVYSVNSQDIVDIPVASSICIHEHLFYEYSEVHPHKTINMVTCNNCGIQVYPKADGENFGINVTRQVNNAISYVQPHFMIGCPKCYPDTSLNYEYYYSLMYNRTKTTKSGVTEPWEQNVLEMAPLYADRAKLAYDTDTLTGNIRATINQYRFDSSDDNMHTDCLVEVQTNDKGEIVIYFDFEGSAGDGPTGVFSGGDTAKESWDDWYKTDFKSSSNSEGIHSGINDAVQRFRGQFNRYCVPISREFCDQHGLSYKEQSTSSGNGDMVNVSIDELLSYSRNNAGSSQIVVTGHSLGGAEAQVFTYRLLNDYSIDKHAICTYTFASVVPFDKSFQNDIYLADVNVYNFINVRDFVPKYGITSRPAGKDASEYDLSNYLDLVEYGIDGMINLDQGLRESLENEFKNALNMAIYQLDLSTDAYPGGFVKNGANIGINVYIDNPNPGNGLVDEHLMETYLRLLNSSSTTYTYVNTSDISLLLQFMAQQRVHEEMLAYNGAGDRLPLYDSVERDRIIEKYRQELFGVYEELQKNGIISN